MLSLNSSGPKGELDDVYHPGELTDESRETNLTLDKRLRHLHVDRLKVMPNLNAGADLALLHPTLVPYALNSNQQGSATFYQMSQYQASSPALQEIAS